MSALFALASGAPQLYHGAAPAYGRSAPAYGGYAGQTSHQSVSKVE